MKKHSSEDWAVFIKSLPLSIAQTLELIDMMHWVYEDGWIQRNKKYHTDTDDHEMRGDWNKSASNLIVENLLK
jgi:hypothetical protein